MVKFKQIEYQHKMSAVGSLNPKYLMGIYLQRQMCLGVFENKCPTPYSHLQNDKELSFIDKFAYIHFESFLVFLLATVFLAAHLRCW